MHPSKLLVHNSQCFAWAILCIEYLVPKFSMSTMCNLVVYLSHQLTSEVTYINPAMVCVVILLKQW